MSYLGHIVSADGVGPEPENIRAMLQWPTPTAVKHLWLCGFFGLTGFYRKFVKNYSSTTYPTTDLLKKDAFDWSPEA